MTPALFGILNVTRDSFSDGGRYLDAEAAVAHGLALMEAGAAVIDIGAAASNPAAEPVPPDTEIARLAPVVAALKAGGATLSIDSFAPAVHAWAAGQGVPILNDIQGFPDSGLYPLLARSRTRMVVMHSVQERGKADQRPVDPTTVLGRVAAFFDRRLDALFAAGIKPEQIILDPGMGFFLGEDPLCSLEVLRGLPRLKGQFGLPLLVSVSRKAFLRKLSGATVAESGPATLAAELFAAAQGADFIRTHDVRALFQALKVAENLRGPSL